METVNNMMAQNNVGSKTLCALLMSMNATQSQRGCGVSVIDQWKAVAELSARLIDRVDKVIDSGHNIYSATMTDLLPLLIEFGN